MSDAKRKTFSREFKLEAVRLMDQGDKSAAELARKLGIKRNQLYKWKEQLTEKGDAAFPGHGRPVGDKEAKIARPKRELERVTEEHYILKKTPFLVCLSPFEVAGSHAVAA